jgi:hypothetical protein
VLPALSITTSTRGVELDPDGYSVIIDATESEPVGLSATLIVERLSDGDHTVQLSGLAPNCSAQGANPRTIPVRAGATASTAFEVICAATVGSIEVSTTTSGSGSDPDGFTLLVDGAEQGAIAGSATIGIGNVSAGSHSVGLTGLAGNCQVAGDNPRTISVSPSQTTQVPFSISCVLPGPVMGTLEITTSTTGSNHDPDGYTVAVDGAAGQPIGLSSSLTLTNVNSGVRQVRLGGLASNCAVSGTNPRNATVTAGQTARVEFNVTCVAPPAETGNVSISVVTSGGAPDPDGYSVTVDGGAPLSLTINGSRTVSGLSAGVHSVQLGGLASNCSVIGENPRPVTVGAGATAPVGFEVNCVVAAPSINLRIERMYLTQSTQRLAGDVPLVQGRDGFVRVFVTANAANSARPTVRVSLYQNGTLARTFAVDARGSSTPTAVQQDGLNDSWNVAVPGELITPGMGIRAEVDPQNQITETSEVDNSFPASAGPLPLTVRSAAPLAIRLVPIFQTATGLQGSVGNPDQLTDLTRRMYPLTSLSTEVRSIFTVAGPLQPDNGNRQWNQILTDLEALRVADNAADRTYYGLVRLNYGAGIVGNGFVGAPSAIGTDNPQDASRVLAHELGHTWGEFHSPCNSPPGVDPAYPYPSGNIGVFGYDPVGGAIKTPSLPDIMGYCANPWVSDYVYERVMSYRRANPMTTAAEMAQSSLLVWGRIENGRPVLEPAFQIVARPHLPRKRGPYSLEGTTADGSRLFSFSFEATPSADDPAGSRHFAFAVPLDPADFDRLQSVRLASPGAPAVATSRPLLQAQKIGPADIAVERTAGAVRLRWNAAAHPVLLVRDPDTGEVLSFARGGDARVQTTKPSVELNVSDGVRSQRVRRAISR